MSIQERYQKLRGAFRRAGQDHVLAFWESLESAQRELLLRDLAAINVAELPALARLAAAPQPPIYHAARLEPALPTKPGAAPPGALERGRSLLSAGKVAAFTVAGGQGTRLGFEGPKGALPISPVQSKPLFQLFAEFVLAAERRNRVGLHWFLMTSPANDAATRWFFEAHGYFGLAAHRVHFFQQGVMPAFDQQGRILLDQKHRVALSPDGHGGSLLALAASGMLAKMAECGIEHISYFQVDNPLVACLDPLFIGLHDLAGSEMSTKTLPKADDLERVGNLVLADGKLAVIEYSDLPEELAHAHNPDGSRRFDCANIAVHMLSRRFIERLTGDRSAFALPWHRAGKRVPFVDLQSGERIEPAGPNAVKLESFIFDALPLAGNPALLETRRAEEFSPVKNATGIDSVETARRDLNRRAARWLASAGVEIPRDAADEPLATCEISPLRAMDVDQLREGPPPRRSLSPGDKFYLE